MHSVLFTYLLTVSIINILVWIFWKKSLLNDQYYLFFSNSRSLEPPGLIIEYCHSNSWWRFRKILWHFQNIWILWTIVCIWKKCLKMRKWAQFLSCCQTDFTFQTFGISFLNEHFYFCVFNFSLHISLNFRKVSKSQTVDSFLSHLKKKA